MIHNPLCPYQNHPDPDCLTCKAIVQASKEAKNEILHFFANEIMKLFLSERAR